MRLRGPQQRRGKSALRSGFLFVSVNLGTGQMNDDKHSRDGDQHRPGSVSNGNERREGRSAVRSVFDGRILEARVDLGNRVERVRTDPPADTGFMLCGECSGDPSQYLIDVEEVCPNCNGEGVRPDPDYEPEFSSFDPHSEFSTMPRLHGRGRGQL